MSWPWSQLGLSGPSSLPEVRRAYAEKVKTLSKEPVIVPVLLLFGNRAGRCLVLLQQTVKIPVLLLFGNGLFGACGFEKGVSRPELRPLYQMLLPAWKARKRKQRKNFVLPIFHVPHPVRPRHKLLRRVVFLGNLFYTLLGVPITMAVMLAACVILASSWFLGFVGLSSWANTLLYRSSGAFLL